MVIVSEDVTNPTVTPFIVADHVVTNPDGSVSFVLSDGTFAGQEPNQHGVRNDNRILGVYQKATRTGALVAFLTRPGDQVFTYSMVEARTY